MSNRKAVFGSIVAAAVAAVACYRGLLWPAISAALLIRGKMPDAWFSGLILFYAISADILVSLAVGGLAYWKVYKYSRQKGDSLRACRR